MAALERGGGETFDLEISRHLKMLGCGVHYLVGAPLFAACPIPMHGADVSKLKSPYLPWFPWDKVRGGWRVRTAEFRAFERAAARWILREGAKFDIVQVCELPYMVHRLKAAGFTKPIVIRLTAPNFYDPEGGVQEADAAIASGTSIAKLREGVRADCVDVPNAVDFEVFKPGASAWRISAGVSRDESVILYVARFQAFKNHEVLLQSFAALLKDISAARLVLVGSGPLRARMESLCESLGMKPRVLFLGEVPFAALPDIYRAADVKVVSSDYESFCFAAIEAMSSGLPVVTTDCGWVPNLIGDRVTTGGSNGPDIAQRQGGLVVPTRDPVALAAAMKRTLEDRQLANACGQWNRTRAVERHGWKSSAERLLDVYRKLVAA